MTLSLRTIGIDVHKDSYTLAAFNPYDSTYSAEMTTGATTTYVLNYLKRFEKANSGCVLKIGYEAGPTGFDLKRELEKKGYECHVMAPTSIYKEAGGKRVKTDRQDARELARTLYWGSYKEVVPLDELDESYRDYIRMRDDHHEALKKAKQNLTSFLLRRSMKYDNKNYWSQRHFAWLRKLEFRNEIDKEIFQEYLNTITSYIDRIALLDAKIEEYSTKERYKEKVDKLKCFTGIDTHTAMVMVTEIGDYNRFGSADRFASYIGLCPGEHSSGETEKKLGITKAGNCHCRRLLCESANSIARSNPYKKSKRLLSRQSGMPAEIIQYADRGNTRIKKKYFALCGRGKNYNAAKAACARELACFIWGMMTGHMEARGELTEG